MYNRAVHTEPPETLGHISMSTLLVSVQNADESDVLLRLLTSLRENLSEVKSNNERLLQNTDRIDQAFNRFTRSISNFCNAL
jgi:hypothetical protein